MSAGVSTLTIQPRSRSSSSKPSNNSKQVEDWVHRHREATRSARPSAFANGGGVRRWRWRWRVSHPLQVEAREYAIHRRANAARLGPGHSWLAEPRHRLAPEPGTARIHRDVISARSRTGLWTVARPVTSALHLNPRVRALLTGLSATAPSPGRRAGAPIPEFI